jgi:hypothetical protein
LLKMQASHTSKTLPASATSAEQKRPQ